jgi:hypothetical protein
VISLPANVSETGKRERKYFKTQILAKEFQKTLKGNLRDHGQKAVTLSARLTMDALEAEKVLSKIPGTTLAQAAKFFMKHHDEAAKCPTMKHSFDEAMHRRGNLSTAYQRDMRGLQKRLPAEFMAMNIYEITGKDISTALDSCNGGLTQWRNAFRTLRAILGDQVKSGTIKTNPCANVHQPRVKRTAEVVIYTPEQVQAVFDCCRDYSTGSNRDCKACAVPFAILFFAGVRPIELTRLHWSDINGDYLRLSGEVTKTGRTRTVHISPTLRAWLDSVPQAEREGKLVPADWEDKAQRVKKEAGICGRKYQDAARHTFGSYTVALEGIDYVRASMGHGHTATFETHYNNALTIPQAKKYLDILPPKSSAKRKSRTA